MGLLLNGAGIETMRFWFSQHQRMYASMGLLLNGAGIETFHISTAPPERRGCMGLLLNGAGIETSISVLGQLSLDLPRRRMGLLLNGAGIETDSLLLH